MEKLLYLNADKSIGVSDIVQTGDAKGTIIGTISSESTNCYDFSVSLNAFDKSIKERGYSGVKGVKLLFNHRPDEVIGVVDEISKKGNALKIKARLNLELKRAKELYSNIAMGVGTGFSVGFNMLDRKEKNKSFEVTEADLHEVSLTYFPANTDCGVEKVLNIDRENYMKQLYDTLQEFKALVLAQQQNNSIHASESIDARLVKIEENIANLNKFKETTEAHLNNQTSLTSEDRARFALIGQYLNRKYK